MGYYINLKDISIDQLKVILLHADLLPSRNVLKENIDARFNIINEHNISHVEELQKTLKSNKKLQEFVKLSGLEEDYLKILIREINSYHPKPNKFKDFPNIEVEVVSKLESEGVTNTFQLYDQVLNLERRIELSKRTGIEISEIVRLTKLADLSRIRWVNHTFAYVLLEAGYDTAEKVANADYEELYHTVISLNDERRIYKGNIGMHDMKLCVQAAKEVSIDVIY